MDTFIKLLDVIAWPATTLVLAFFFRVELRAVFSRISVLKYKDWEVKFEKGLGHVEEKIGELKKVPIEAEESLDRLERLTETSPRAAILEAWIELEQVLFHMAEIYQIKGRSPSRIIEILRQKGILTEGLASAFNEMRQLRNDAAHVPDFVIEEKVAKRFIALSSSMSLLLKKIDEI
jgi:uncharacterized protein YutE (UPF0331/DUF86 family)